MTYLPVIGTCGECIHSGPLDFGDVCCPRYGFRHGWQESCENFNKPTGLRWSYRKQTKDKQFHVSPMVWMIDGADGELGFVRFGSFSGAFFAFKSKAKFCFIHGTLHECARALVAAVTSKESK